MTNPFHYEHDSIYGVLDARQKRNTDWACPVKTPFSEELDRRMAVFGEVICSEPWRNRCAGAEYGAAPWIEMPPDGRRFQASNGIAVPALAFINTDILVVSFQTPLGWDGIITSQVNLFTGAGFAEGGGDIIWRLRIGKWWVNNCDAINTTLGSLANAYPLEGSGVRLLSGQLVQYFADVTSLASIDPNARIVAKVAGWIWPRR